MDEALTKHWVIVQQDRRILEAINRERARLLNFIRRRVPDPLDAEDILQEVFYEFVEAYRMMKPVEHATAWLYRVARNRIIDLFRKNSRAAKTADPAGQPEDDAPRFFPLASPAAGPEAAFARSVLLDELEAALDELPEEQREVFLAHEVMGYSFNELSAKWGVSVNTLLSRKHYAVLHLRRRLQAIYDEFTMK